MMHTIVETGDDVWTVGYYDPADAWQSLQDFDSFADAAAMCSYLNGGLEPSLADRLKRGAFR